MGYGKIGETGLDGNSEKSLVTKYKILRAFAAVMPQSLTFAELEKKAEISRSALWEHLTKMEKEGLVAGHKTGETNITSRDITDAGLSEKERLEKTVCIKDFRWRPVHDGKDFKEISMTFITNAYTPGAKAVIPFKPKIKDKKLTIEIPVQRLKQGEWKLFLHCWKNKEKRKKDEGMV